MFKELSQANARDIMSREVLTLSSENTISEAVQIMSQHNVGSLVVSEHGKIAGIFTERDLMRRVIGHGIDPKKIPLGEVMTRKVEIVQASDNAILLLEKMCDNNFRHLPVLDGEKLVGMISLKHFYRFFLASRQSMGV